MDLHMRSSICTTSECVRMPLENATSVLLSYLSVFELKWRIGHVPFTGRKPYALL
jgi:hypothetical protein